MRGRDDPNLDVHGPFSADPDDLAILDDAKEPDLGCEGKLPDLVEEQGAAVRLLEPALAASNSAREGALLVAEKLRVDQLRRNRAAVHATERTAPKRRVLVNRAGDDLLAGSCFAEQQHRSAAAGHHPRARHHRRQPRVAANEPLFARAGVAVDVLRREGRR